MTSIDLYKPVQFYLIAILGTWFFWFIAAFLSHQQGAAREKETIKLLLIFLGMIVPFITALSMIYGSKSVAMIHDFWDRLLIAKIDLASVLIFVLIVPTIFFLGTALSLLWGKSPEQFAFASDFDVMKGWRILSLIIPLILAPTLEELGWRGYGVDSLRCTYNLLATSLIFAALWGLWHLPLFFIKGYFHYGLWNLNIIYVINFFVSLIPVSILFNWLYYKNFRSVLIIILAHALLNLLSVLFRIEPFTKCLITLLLCAAAAIVVWTEREMFFGKTMHQMIRGELIELQSSYGFPGMTFAYILPDGTASSGAIGWADKEKKRKMTPQNRMLAASIGKSFVSAVILQLAHEHRLTLDDSLEKWLGDRPWFLRLPNHSKITLRHLLTHTSGLPDHVHMTAFLNAYAKRWQKPNSPFNHEELVGFVLDQPPLFESGKGWMYTDTGYILLGLVIESVTHHSYEYELDKRLLQPLHLKDTSPSDRPDLDRLAAGYTMPNNPFGLPIKTLAETNVMVWNPAFEWTGGGLVSTSLDLARWVKLLCEGHAMKGEYVHTLFQRVSAGPGLYYGAGITVTENDSFGLIYGHWGVIPGYVSSMRYFSKCGVACAFQINTDIGVSDHSTHLLNEMEERIAKIIVSYVQNHLHLIGLFRN